MSSTKSDMEGGFAAYLEGLRAQPGEASITLVQFDEGHEVVYTEQPLATAPALKLEPRGHTALLDAMADVIDQTGKRLELMPESQRPDRVLFLVLTDGAENSSRRTTRADLAKRITHQRDVYKWEFIYLGANQDSFAEAAQMGISVRNAGNYKQTSSGIARAFTRATHATNRYRGGGSAAMDAE